MLKHLNSNALLEVRPKLYCSTLCVVQHPLEIELFPLATNLFFLHLHFDDDITGNVRQIMPLF